MAIQSYPPPTTPPRAQKSSDTEFLTPATHISHISIDYQVSSNLFTKFSPEKPITIDDSTTIAVVAPPAPNNGLSPNDRRLRYCQGRHKRLVRSSLRSCTSFTINHVTSLWMMPVLEALKPAITAHPRSPSASASQLCSLSVLGMENRKPGTPCCTYEVKTRRQNHAREIQSSLLEVFRCLFAFPETYSSQLTQSEIPTAITITATSGSFASSTCSAPALPSPFLKSFL